MDPISDLRGAVSDAASELRGDGPVELPHLERPPRPDFGDYSTNAAMLLAPSMGESPRAIAERLGQVVGDRLGEAVERVEIAGPGFLNLFMADAWYLDALAGLIAAGERYGEGRPETAERVNVEFVSANPTGPLTVASGRHAAYGDSLCRILELAGQRGRARVLRERPRQPGRSASASRSRRGPAARTRPTTATAAAT